MTDVIQSSFAGGELAPSLHGAVDLAKYESALEICENCYINYKGGVSNRNGTEFIGYAASNNSNVRLIPFQFKVSQTYILEFSHHKMRVIKDGGFVLKTAVAITAIVGDWLTVGPGHGFVVGDTVTLATMGGMPTLNGVIAKVSAIGATEIALVKQDDSPLPLPGTYTGGGTVAAYFTLELPYDQGHLFQLKFVQSADVLTITHRKYKQRDITREGHADWTVTEIEIGSSLTPPENLKFLEATARAASSNSLSMYAYVVTTVDRDGEESIPSDRLDFGPVVNIGFESGSVSFKWDPVQGADGYNVYKALPVSSGNTVVSLPKPVPVGASFGFIAFTKSTTFRDSNIVPDFSQSPPTHFDPFADGPIIRVNITNPGSGYDQQTIGYVINTSTGSGAILEPIVDDTGRVTGVLVLKQGKDYRNSDTVDFTNGGGPVPGGSGATALASISDGGVDSVSVTAPGSGYINPVATVPAPDTPGLTAVLQATQVGGQIISVTVTNPGSGYTLIPAVTIAEDASPPPTGDATGQLRVGEQKGNWPGSVAYFQQRRAYASSDNEPETLWMSQPGLFGNFDVSRPLRDDDSITASLISRQVNDIKYMIEMPGGLVILTGGSNAWQLSGGGQNEPISPLSMIATPQAFSGCADVTPISINYDILYVQAHGNAVRDLTYNFFTNIYQGEDISVLSNHMFAGYTIRQWTWAEEPQRIVWAIRTEDGALLALTFLKEQKILAWTRSLTQGMFRSVASINESIDNAKHDAVYFVVRRFINGKWVQLIERMAPTRTLFGAEDAWFVDCALQSPLTFPNSGLSGSGVTGTVIFTADIPVFTAADNGKILRMGGGIGRVMEYLGPTEVRVELQRDIVAVLPQYNESDPLVPLPVEAGDWSLTAEKTVFGGLDHLNNCLVSILADGSVIPQQVVVDGKITLPQAASKVVIGLPFSSSIRTLRIETGPPTVQGKRKHVSGLTIRVVNTRGLKYGKSFENLYPVKDRSTEVPGQPTNLFTGDYYVKMEPLWDTDGQLCLRQDDPLPMNILALVPDITMGDTYSR